MKVELDNIRLGHSSLTDKIYAGILVPSKQPSWKHKVDVTNDFITAVINRWENKSENISSGNDEWEITVKKLNNK